MSTSTDRPRLDAAPLDAAPFREPEATADEAALLPPKLQLRLAAWYRLAGHLDRAAALLDEMEMGGPTASLADERMALAVARRDADGVRTVAEERLRLHPAPSAKAAYAKAMLELGDIEAATRLAEEVVEEAPDLMTVQAIAAEVALQCGDPGEAHERSRRELEADPSRVAPRLLLARVALLSGDADEARRTLDEIVGDESLTPGQAGTAAGLADLLGQPTRAQALRLRVARQEAARAAALADEIDAALGRSATDRAVSSPVASRASRPVGERQGPSADGRGGGNGNGPRIESGGDAVGLAGTGPGTGIGRGNGARRVVVDAEEATVEVAPVDAPEAGGDGGVEFEPVEVIADEDPADPRVLPTLRELWGFPALRPGQAAVINRALAGQDALAIMPTGAGKSLTFQLPAVLDDGLTLVISPLIALMKDQVEGLPAPVRERTALLNSSLPPDEQRRRLDGIAAGDYAMVYAAPERLRQHAFLRALQSGKVARVVVDEAHCISLWGHDFRPDYLSIPAALPTLGDPPVLAITATATREMERGIAAGFGRELEVIRSSVFRPNLRYAVEMLPDRQTKIDRIVALCRQERGAAIVYVSSRRDAETIADLLRRAGVGAVPYHAGMDSDTRSRHQERFMAGQARVVVATVAFGMGVDKADVRLIIHASPPGSLEAYAQESGRAGRDGLPALCVMLATARDRTALRRLAGRDALDLDDLRRAYTELRRRAVGRWAILNPSTLALGDPHEDPDEAADPRIALNLLEQGRLVRRHPDAPTGWTLRPDAGKEGGAGTGTGTDAGTDVDADAGGESGASTKRTTGPLWEAVASWLGIDSGATAHGERAFATAEACDALGCTPLELAAALAEAPGWSAREAARLGCWELLPAGADAAGRMNAVMLESKRRAERRIAAVIDYQAGRRCRHVALARHLGERLEPCGTACDVCDPDPDAADHAPTPIKQRSSLTTDDLLAVVLAVRSLEYPVGKKRLALLLTGSRESKFNPGTVAFGSLKDVRRARIEDGIDRLVEAGILEVAPEEEYRVVRPTPEARSVTADDLAPLLGRAGASSVRATGGFDDSDLDADLLDRLVAWRRERASEDAVPAYVVAPNTTLEEVARVHPTTVDELAGVTGFGPARIERYGDEVLALVKRG